MTVPVVVVGVVVIEGDREVTTRESIPSLSRFARNLDLSSRLRSRLRHIMVRTHAALRTLTLMR